MNAKNTTVKETTMKRITLTLLVAGLALAGLSACQESRGEKSYVQVPDLGLQPAVTVAVTVAAWVNLSHFIHPLFSNSASNRSTSYSGS